MEHAMAHAEREDWAEALRYVGHALDGAPDDPDILTFAGHLHREVEAWPQAADRFNQALSADAGRPEASLGLAESLLALGDPDGAAETLAGMRLTDTDEQQHARAVALAEAAGRPDLALELMASIPGADTDVDIRRARARLSLAAGREDDALQGFEALHRDGLLDESGALSYAWMLNERGAHADALEVLERGPDSPDVAELAARTALWADQFDRARNHIATLPEGSRAAQDLTVLLDDAQARRTRAAFEAARRAEAEAEAARLRDTPPADPAQALEFWRARLEDDPSNALARAEMVALLEAFERFDEALDALMGPDPIDRVAADGGPRAVHAARLSLWAGRPSDAVRLLEPSGGPTELLARARFESDDVEGAYRTLGAGRTVRGADPSPTDASLLLLTARVADAAGRPAEAAEALGALSRVRELDVQELDWWAGLLWRSGGLEGALVAYEGISELRPEDPAVYRAIGDLRQGLDDPQGAEAAYRDAIRLGGPGDAAGPGLGLALQRQGRDDEAAEAYTAYLEARPADADARLALARVLARTGAFERAGLEYERAAGPSAEADTQLSDEIARAWMAAGEHQRAEPWARRAAADPAQPLSRARHAHLLALLDRHDASAAVTKGLANELSAAPPTTNSLEDALVRAWIHRLQGRPLAALRALEDQVVQHDTSSLAIEVRVFQAEVREARGDLSGARADVAEARGTGAAPTDLQHLEQAFERRSLPRAATGIEAGSDARELDVTTVWARVGFRPAELGAPVLSAEVRHRNARQLGATGDGTAFLASADSLFVSDALRLDARIGLEWADRAETRMLGAVSATLETLNATRWSLDVSRLPVWSEAQRRGAPEYARVSNLGALDPDLMVNEARLAVSTVPANPERRSAHGEVGVARYSDGNDRLFGYAQWRLPIHARQGTSLALTPNAYAEGYGRAAESYASPSSFIALGLAAEGSRTFGRLTLDGRANPHVYRLPGDTGVGIEGRLGLTLGTALGDLRIEGRYLEQGRSYDLFRLGSQLTLPLGGGPN
jgi:tetratricopeptide (TPR) repeat protein